MSSGSNSSEPGSSEQGSSERNAPRLNSLGLAKAPAQTRVVVAMSGGADSSVVAGLLKREGYDVVGVTLQLYDHGAAIHRKGACCAGQDIHDARNVAATLGIPHYVLDYEDRFRQEVIDRFAESYAHGETPIPCVECNRTVKFRDLLAMAGELDADVMATGHYVENRALPDGRFALCRPADLARDQSYFLYATTAAQLTRLRFPLAGLTKAQTRAFARDLGLSIAEKPDSQDICFVPSGKYADIVAKFRPEAARPGVVRHVDGRVLGQHSGVMNFTVGQRKGLGIAGREPLYVVGIDAQDSAVIVGPREALLVEAITLRDVNWLGDAPLPTREAGGLPLFVRVRSTREPKPARAWRLGEGVQVEIEGGESGVAPGQACVLYDGVGVGARVLGGGTIERKQVARPAPALHAATAPLPSSLATDG